MKKSLFVIIPFFSAALAAGTLNASDPGPVIPFTESNWQTTLAENGGESRLETMAGQQTIFLRNGRLDLKGVEFATGTIEFDILTQGERGFGGLRWHVQADGRNFEEFYIRPHMSGNPDANQYTPVFNGLSGWQIYFGPNYSAPVSYTMGEWTHVKLVVTEDQAEVYIDSEEPVLIIDDLRGDFGKGGLSLYANMTAFHFANFRYQELEQPELTGTPQERKALPEHLVTQFAVSGTVPESLVADATTLPRSELGDSWTTIGVENNGVADLARAAVLSREANTVFVRVNIRSERDQVKTLNFGYSDRVRVFLGDKPLYAGNNTYRTRDYRYLGTVGLFDQLYLPLKTGNNELYFAVSESFGGWGIMAAFEDMAGIQID
jgi:hypothetical protein